MAGVQYVNIRRDVDDKFYRYRMPVLLTKIEGKGNGIKTVLPNMSDVSRSLSRPPTYPTKFFGCELGAQTSFDEKSDRYIVNGAHDAAKLRDLLDNFIIKFVLCGSCKNPETDLTITKNEDLIRDCKACGERTNVDMRHKLVTFILKNPPKVPKKSKGTKKQGTADNQGTNGPNSPKAEAEEPAVDGGESDDELTKKIKSEAADLNQNATIVGEDWSVDTSAEAVKARMKSLEGGMGNVKLGDDDSGEEGNGDDPYSQLGVWVAENQDEGPVEVFKKVQEMGLEKKHRAVQVLAQTLFTEDILEEIKLNAPIFLKMVTSEKHQKALLGGLERFVGVDHPDLTPLIPKILMEFYQIDVLDEEIIKQWGTHVSRKYVDKETSKKVRKASEPFLKWLDEAEDDDDDDE
ncbi:eukaryotic translation initiation factor 5 [Thelephora ganbajun]|uniref:Eukaryotic translation initiation factor 5 n=1 Tax=Thelephora ganbajun TaxID=370292 RepID=A0ACB6ZV34_THEGA|nr:eukaryotic translation initiation factor 5 [Thelephora ganbajun]